MLLGTLGASLLENILAGKGIIRAGSGLRSWNSCTSNGNKKKELQELVMEKKWVFLPPHPLTNL